MDGREDIVQYVVLRVCGREERKRRCASGSVVEYRLAKARVAGSNPVSRLIVKSGSPVLWGFRCFILEDRIVRSKLWWAHENPSAVRVQICQTLR